MVHYDQFVRKGDPVRVTEIPESRSGLSRSRGMSRLMRRAGRCGNLEIHWRADSDAEQLRDLTRLLTDLLIDDRQMNQLMAWVRDLTVERWPFPAGLILRPSWSLADHRPAIALIVAVAYERCCGGPRVLDTVIEDLCKKLPLTWFHLDHVAVMARYLERDLREHGGEDPAPAGEPGRLRKQKSPAPSKGGASNEIPPSRKLAAQSLLFALCRDRSLLAEPLGCIYKWLCENQSDDEANPYHGGKLPNERTWKSYLRAVCNQDAMRDQAKKEWAFADSRGSSVVDIGQIDYRQIHRTGPESE